MEQLPRRAHHQKHDHLCGAVAATTLSEPCIENELGVSKQLFDAAYDVAVGALSGKEPVAAATAVPVIDHHNGSPEPVAASTLHTTNPLMR